ncbi:hypothetical protein HYX18_03275 [Candidatus Woesearchaeota archaeon]|nr:hypothetical protein [Candidatus Woesearchaeota archaeon]
MASPLQNAIEFLREFGLFDIVLPFLLVFTLVFAILEKTRILGVEGEGKNQLPKKNLNSMVAFVFALIVVATNKIVTAINSALPNVVLLLVVFVAFLLLISTFSKTEEMDFKSLHPGYYNFFVFVSIATIVLIFLGSITNSKGQSWLSFAWDYAINNFEGAVVSSLIFLAVILGAIFWVVRPAPKTKGSGGA